MGGAGTACWSASRGCEGVNTRRRNTAWSCFFFTSRRRHTRLQGDWSSDVCSSDLPDRRLATQLVYGVLRRRGTLDTLLRPFVHREPHQVEPWLWEALRLGAFQLLLDRKSVG